MAELNVDTVNILNEADLTNVAAPNLTDVVHLTQGRKATVQALKTSILNGENTADTDLNAIPAANSISLESSTGSNTTIPDAVASTSGVGGTAGVLSATRAEKIDGLPATVDGSETIIQAGANAGVTGTGTAGDPYIITSTGGGSSLTDAQVKTAYENNANTNAFTDAEQTKLASIEAGADVTDNVNVDAAGAVMNTDISTAAMAFVVDEDNMVSNSNTRVPTQQSVKAYVDANAGATPYTQQTLASKVKVLAKLSAVTYVETSGTGTLTIAEFGDIAHASIPLTQGVSYSVDGDFTLNIVFSDNSVNTWEPVANNTSDVNNQDIYIPKIEAYGYNLPFFTGAKELTQLNIGNTPVVPSSITWNAGTLTLTYTDSSSFGGNDNIILNIDFPKK